YIFIIFSSQFNDFIPVERNVEGGGPAEIRSCKEISFNGEFNSLILNTSNILQGRRKSGNKRNGHIIDQISSFLMVVVGSKPQPLIPKTKIQPNVKLGCFFPS